MCFPLPFCHHRHWIHQRQRLGSMRYQTIFYRLSNKLMLKSNLIFSLPARVLILNMLLVLTSLLFVVCMQRNFSLLGKWVFFIQRFHSIRLNDLALWNVMILIEEIARNWQPNGRKRPNAFLTDEWDKRRTIINWKFRKKSSVDGSNQSKIVAWVLETVASGLSSC